METPDRRNQANDATNSGVLMSKYLSVLLIAVSSIFWFCGPPKPDSVPESEESKGTEKTTQELMKDLRSENAFERSEAIINLGQRKEKNSIPEIRKILKNDPSANVRYTAALILADFKDKSALPLILSMQSQNPPIPVNIFLDALGRMADKSASEKAVPYLESKMPTIRLLAVDALVKMNAKASCPRILQMAKSSQDWEKAKTYAMVLGDLGYKPAENYLIQLAQNGKPSPTLAATYYALGSIRSKKGIPVLVEAITSDFLKGRENSTQALIEIGDPQALQSLFPLLTDDSRDIRFSAAEVFVGIPTPSFAPKILSLLKSRNTIAYGSASYILGRYKYEEGRLTIESLLADKTNPEREIMARSLGWNGNTESAKILIQVIGESEGEGRYGAAWALGFVGGENAIPALKKATNSSDNKLVALSLEALGSIQSEKSLPILNQSLEDKPEMAPASLGAIAAIPGDKARVSLENWSESRNLSIQKIAIVHLGERKDSKSLPTLMGLVEKDDPEIRSLVYQALHVITGESFTTRSAWLQWYKSKK